MATGNNDGRRVVRTWSDASCQTGESLVRLADGSVWKTWIPDSVPAQVTGVRRGLLIDGRVYEK